MNFTGRFEIWFIAHGTLIAHRRIVVDVFDKLEPHKIDQAIIKILTDGLSVAGEKFVMDYTAASITGDDFANIRRGVIPEYGML